MLMLIHSVGCHRRIFFFAELEVEICLKLVGFLSADYLSVFVRFELDVLACVSVL